MSYDFSECLIDAYARLAGNSASDSLQVVVYVPIRHSEYPISLFTKPSLAYLIARGGFFVAQSIEFYNQFQLPATEIRNVRSDRFLPPEFQSSQTPPSQHRPEDLFRRRGFSTKTAGTVQHHGVLRSWLVGHRKRPPNSKRPHPQPLSRKRERGASSLNAFIAARSSRRIRRPLKFTSSDDPRCWACSYARRGRSSAGRPAARRRCSRSRRLPWPPRA